MKFILTIFAIFFISSFSQKIYANNGTSYIYQNRFPEQYNRLIEKVESARDFATYIGNVNLLDTFNDLIEEIIEYAISNYPPNQISFREFEWLIFDLTNEYRENNGLPPFIWREDIAIVSRNFSRDLVENNLMGHIGSNNSTPADRLAAAGIAWSSLAENVDQLHNSTPNQIVQRWIDSEGHRNNLLGNELYIGIGFYTDGYRTRIVQKFFTPQFGPDPTDIY
ncbi:MAG: CAP domain-containing protein [Defluviitaleaceae bacterium]|nr:CAP domain-containing protein [Defluviitaleaceae bacterium]